MFAIILSLRCSIRQGFRIRAAIQAEISCSSASARSTKSVDCTIATSESPPEWALDSSRNVAIAYPACVFKRGQRRDSCESQSPLAIEEASAPFDLHEWGFW